MKPLPAHPFILLLAVLLTTVSCSTDDHLRLNSDDLTALNKIYAASPWTVQNTKLDLQARAGGAVDLTLEGVARRKANDTGPVWLPVAMMDRLPSYFEATDLSTSRAIELEAYRVPGGNWLITVVVPEPENIVTQPTPSSTPSPTPTLTPATAEPGPSPTSSTVLEPSQTAEAPTPSADLRISVTMVSQDFLTGFPILIPSGEGQASIAATVTLPQRAQFSTLNLAGSGPRATESSTLTILPASLTEGTTRAATRLTPESGVAWNFSGVTFNQTAPSQWRPWFLPSSALILAVAITLWWWSVSFRNYETHVFSLEQKKEKLLKELKDESRNLITRSHAESDPTAEAELKLQSFLLAETEHSYIDEAQKRVSESIYQSFSKGFQGEGELRKTSVQLVSSLIVRIRRLNDDVRFLTFSHRKRTLVLWALFAVVVASMIWLLSTVGAAQPNSQVGSNKNVVTRLATLAELNVDILPQNPTSDNYDKVNVDLRFFPLSEVRGKRTFEEISIGVSDQPNLSIDPVQLPSGSAATLVQETGKLFRLKVPVSFAPVLQRWKTLADWKPVDFSATQEYFNNLNAASKINVSYSIKGAQKVTERAKGKFFHWFPFDSVEVQFPLDLRQPAIVSQINLTPATSEFVSTPSLEGLNNPFVEAENGRSYQSTSQTMEGRAAIWASKPVIVKAIFQRPGWQRFLLTVGQTILSVAVGFLIGFGTTLSDKAWLNVIIGILGVFALPLAARSAVLARYEHLPSLLVGEGVTLFEIIFLANVVILALVSYVVNRKFRVNA
jgi:hypothetical protein